MTPTPKRRNGATTTVNQPHPVVESPRTPTQASAQGGSLGQAQGAMAGPSHLRQPLSWIVGALIAAVASLLGVVMLTEFNPFVPFAAIWAASLVGDIIYVAGMAATLVAAASLAIRSRRQARPALTALAVTVAFLGTAVTFAASALWSAGNGHFAEYQITSFYGGGNALLSRPAVDSSAFFQLGLSEVNGYLPFAAAAMGIFGVAFAAAATPLAFRLLDRRLQSVVVGTVKAPRGAPTSASTEAMDTSTAAPAAWTAAQGAPTEARIRWNALVSAGLLAPKRATAAANGNGHAHSLHDADPHKWVQHEAITDTGQVPLPELLIDEVIGQEEAVEVAKKAARQRRHLLLLGDPGTGKSMIAKAMAQLLPPVQLDEVLLFPNPKDENVPHVKSYPGGEGRAVLRTEAQLAKRRARMYLAFEVFLSALILGVGVASIFLLSGAMPILILVMCVMAVLIFVMVTRQMGSKPYRNVPNLMIERPTGEAFPPYVDATGSHAGALLGDVRHDPFQSGGLQTPTHLRVEPGAIHRAHKGLLFIDEINVLRLDSQQALLTALQDRKYGITGQSDKSSGAQTKTEPVPCDFILVAAGNMDVIAPTDHKYTGLHPALRSRIRGYGYEVYVKAVMDDNDDNRRKLVRFIAQEVRRDGRIPHFDGPAVAEVLREAQRRSGHTGKLTLRLRELGGLVRTAGDIARDEGASLVGVDHVLAAKRMSMSLEYQVTRRGIEVTTAKEALTVGGERIGCAIGSAFLGTGETGEPAGIVVPVEADATPTADRQKGTLFLGGGLEKDAGVADTVSAVMKRLRGAAMADVDVHAQALLEQPGANVQALEAATVLACISALEHLPVRQDTVVIGEVAVGGRIRAVEGITQMIEGAADLGYKRAVVPAANKSDILLEHRYRAAIDVILVEDVADVLRATVPGKSKNREAALESLLHRHTVKARKA